MCCPRRFFLDEKAGEKKQISWAKDWGQKGTFGSCSSLKVYHVPGEPDAYACEIYGSCVRCSIWQILRTIETYRSSAPEVLNSIFFWRHLTNSFCLHAAARAIFWGWISILAVHHQRSCHPRNLLPTEWPTAQLWWQETNVASAPGRSNACPHSISAIVSELLQHRGDFSQRFHGKLLVEWNDVRGKDVNGLLVAQVQRQVACQQGFSGLSLYASCSKDWPLEPNVEDMHWPSTQMVRN